MTMHYEDTINLYKFKIKFIEDILIEFKGQYKNIDFADEAERMLLVINATSYKEAYEIMNRCAELARIKAEFDKLKKG